MTDTRALTGAAMYGIEGTPLERVGRLREVIASGGDRAQQLRRLPDDCVEVLIDEGMGCSEPKTRQWCQYAVKQITGWMHGMSDTEWREHWRQEVRSGARPLPYGMKKIP